MDKKHETKQNHPAVQFPPVVAVLGHVDHGKTSLLDAVRKSSIADREFGGITQAIGASSIETLYEGKKRRITFIDTPGHEAFTKMRSRGAQAADIGLLIVSAVDGVMPQTKESIQMLTAAQIPFIVVLTKADLPTKNPEKVKQQIVRENVLLEGYGGDVPVIEISAKTGTNIKELLDLILLVNEMRNIGKHVSATGPVEAIVIESKLDSRAGAKATVIVKNGTIRPRDLLASEGTVFRVRGLIGYLGEQLKEVSVGEGVELLGTEKVLSVGSIVTSKEQAVAVPEQAVVAGSGHRELVYQRKEKDNSLALILCADTQGSLEAIIYSLPEEVKVISQKTGEITEADVLMAKSTGALVLGFNIKIRPDVLKLAYTEKILVKNYKIIYEMLDEINDVLEGKALALLEVILGQAKVLAVFPYEKTLAYGISVIEGRVARGDKVRVMRGDTVVGETTMHSLRVGKNATSKVEKGHEAGIVLNHKLDITIGDMLICVN
jgi:translation initiation factor IF-2